MPSFDSISGYTRSKGANLRRSFNTKKTDATIFANKMISFLSTFLTVVLVLAVSVFVYATFYHAYMPVEMHNLPVNLYFKPCEDGQLKCSHPTAQIPLKRNQKLLQGQPYSVSLLLDIPDNPKNEDHGMFMSCLKIESAKGDELGAACKSSISEYRSPLLRTMDTLTYSPVLLTGLSSQKQALYINYFTNFQAYPHTPAEMVTVEIQSKHLQIREAILEIHAELKGLRYLMYRHPWFSSFIGVTSNVIILTTIILVSWSRFQQQEAESRHEKSYTVGSLNRIPTAESSMPSTIESGTTSIKPPTAESGIDSEAVPTLEPISKGASVDSSDIITCSPNEAEIVTSAPNGAELVPSTPNEVDAEEIATGDELLVEPKASVTWFLLKVVFKLLWQSAKFFILAAIVILSYEAFNHGVENTKALMEATKEDTLLLVKLVGEKVEYLIKLFKTKIMQ